MIDDYDINEDFAAIVEYNFDVEGDMLYLEPDIEYYFTEVV